MDSARRVLRVAVIIFLVGASATPAQSAIKSGDRCRIESQIESSKGRDFNCVKIGKKLVWRKLPKTALPSKTVTPTTASPSPTPTTAVVPTGSPEQMKAIENIKASLIPQSKGNPLRFHFSPNAVKEFQDFLVKESERSMAYWGSVYNTSDPFNVFYGTEQDLQWIIDAWKPYGYDNGFADDLRGRIAREGTRLNAGAVPSQRGTSHLSILRHANLKLGPGDKSFIAHESVHIVQQNLTGSRTFAMPCWLREGSANLFANIMAGDFHGVDYEQFKRNDMNNYLWGTSGIDVRKFTADEWFTHIKGLEGNFSGTCDYIYRFSYGTGLLISEIFVADFGFDAMMNLWRGFRDDVKLETLFRAVAGRELDTWYKESAIPYVIREYARVGR